MHATDERLTELETLVAFQEQTIEDLNQVVQRQQHEIDELKRRFDRLVEKISVPSEALD